MCSIAVWTGPVAAATADPGTSLLLHGLPQPLVGNALGIVARKIGEKYVFCGDERSVVMFDIGTVVVKRRDGAIERIAVTESLVTAYASGNAWQYQMTKADGSPIILLSDGTCLYHGLFGPDLDIVAVPIVLLLNAKPGAIRAIIDPEIQRLNR